MPGRSRAGATGSGRAHARYVINTTKPTAIITAEGGQALLWVGPDDRGLELEIVAVVLPEARAQELANEVLERAGRGRPSLSRPGIHSPQLRLSVSDELRSRLIQRAEDEHRSVSTVARAALEHYLAS